MLACGTCGGALEVLIGGGVAFFLSMGMWLRARFGGWRR